MLENINIVNKHFLCSNPMQSMRLAPSSMAHSPMYCMLGKKEKTLSSGQCRTKRDGRLVFLTFHKMGVLCKSSRVDQLTNKYGTFVFDHPLLVCLVRATHLTWNICFAVCPSIVSFAWCFFLCIRKSLFSNMYEQAMGVFWFFCWFLPSVCRMIKSLAFILTIYKPWRVCFFVLHFDHHLCVVL